MSKFSILSTNQSRFLLTNIALVFSLNGLSLARADSPAAFYESRNDHYRTGVNLKETILNTSNVNSSQFGLLFTLPVDTWGVNQILYAPQITINNVVHNVIIATTLAGTVYCFDADKPGPALWIQKFNKGRIRSTPVIDPSSNTIYVVNRESVPVQYTNTLHALDLSSGAEKFGGPVVIKDASYSDSENKYTVNYNDDPLLENHAGLALVNGRIIISIAGFEDVETNYHGWLLAYDAKTLKQTGVFTTILAPPATGGSISQAGRAPVIDDQNNIYVFVGNSFPATINSNAYDGKYNFSESLLKLSLTVGSPNNPVSNELKLVDSFTPSNWHTLDIGDMDLSSSGPTLIPGTSILFGGGKWGSTYVWNTNHLGGMQANDSQVLQKFTAKPIASQPGFIYAGAIFWNRDPKQGSSIMYNLYKSSPIFGFTFNKQTNRFNTVPFTSSSVTESANTGIQNTITLSANAGLSGTGIVWELQSNPAGRNSILRAFNAENLKNELWNSSEYLSDSLVGTNDYTPPTVINGKVYTHTLSAQISVFGLISTTITPVNNQITKLGTSVNLKINATDSNSDKLIYSAIGLPSGLSINATNGVITGKPSTLGSYTVVISVSNSKESPQTISFKWTISN